MVKVGSGDYWRVPTPFARPAVQATKLRRDGAMILAAEKELQRLEK